MKNNDLALPAIPSADEMQEVYDLIIARCQYSPHWHRKGASALQIINRLHSAATALADAQNQGDQQ